MFDFVRFLSNQSRSATLSIYMHRATGEEVVVKQACKRSPSPSSEDEAAVVSPSDAPSPVVIAVTHDSIEQELRVTEVLRDHPHANIVRCFPTPVYLPSDALVMEHCSRGDLFSLLEEQPQRLFDEVNAIRYFREVVNGVRHLHSLDIAHRDLSLENVLLDDQGHAKICDFGLSARASVLADNCVGKLQYMAPEVAGGVRKYDPIVADVWSLGIMLFIMLTGSPLYAIAVPSDPAWGAIQRVGVAGILGSWQMRERVSENTLALLSGKNSLQITFWVTVTFWILKTSLYLMQSD
jgi:serine/threonine protein kinase